MIIIRAECLLDKRTASGARPIRPDRHSEGALFPELFVDLLEGFGRNTLSIPVQRLPRMR